MKQELIRYLAELLQQRKDEAQAAIDALQAARNSDTKSSAGDKYETGRAMMQMEIDKAGIQLAHIEGLVHDLSRIDPDKNCDVVEVGSLVRTSNGTFLLGVAIGRFAFVGETYHGISTASPIGRVLAQRRAGEKVSFQGKEISVVSVL